MTRKKLVAAAWLAMASALLTIPWLMLTFFLADKKGIMPKAAEVGMLVVGTTLTVYLLLTLQELLHERYDFHQADRAISLLIKVNIVTAAVTILGLTFPLLESGIGVFAIIMVVVLGGLQMAFGMSLLRLPDDLGGLRKPYCYLNMVTGVCLLSIVLLPIGIVTGAVADVMLGTIFFQLAPKPE